MNKSSGNNVTFASEGFDLSQATSEDQVLELAGNAPTSPPTNDDAIGDAEACKAKGNEHFAQHEWKEAYDWYTKAIEATPGDMTGDALLELQQEWEEEQTRSWREQLREYEAAKLNEGKNSSATDKPEEPERKTFQPPPHPHGDNLAVYYSNRAAASLHMAAASQQDPVEETVIRDCTIAVLLRPTYVKAWVRRATAHERNKDTEKALQDIQHARTLSDTPQLRQQEERLQKLEDERLETLKAETMDKLKDLGNSLLGNFGLSLDNFKTEQDPNTGSYSISFQNN